MAKIKDYIAQLANPDTRERAAAELRRLVVPTQGQPWVVPWPDIVSALNAETRDERWWGCVLLNVALVRYHGFELNESVFDLAEAGKLVEALGKTVERNEGSVQRRLALESLGRIAHADVFRESAQRLLPMIRGLVDAAADVPLIECLGLVGNAADHDRILQALRKNPADERFYDSVIGALSNIHWQDYAPVIELLGSTEPLIRRIAADVFESVGEYGAGAEHAVPVLVKLIDNEDESVRIAAHRALIGMGDAAHELVLAETHNGPVARRLTFLDIAVQSGKDSFAVRDRLVELLGENEPEMRLAAIELLADFHYLSSDAEQEVLALLNDPDDETRFRAVDALEWYQEWR